MAGRKIGAVIVTRSLSAGTATHYEAGERLEGDTTVLARLVGMGKARWAAGDELGIGPPEVTSRRATRGGASA